ncbi:hypothetical protein Barb4_01825 [Bacteroidales bacterium Barb4]|nr:hypothetical protein Barb4_01825 [Bacteroidales bacterium Barb4]
MPVNGSPNPAAVFLNWHKCAFHPLLPSLFRYFPNEVSLPLFYIFGFNLRRIRCLPSTVFRLNESLSLQDVNGHC